MTTLQFQRPDALWLIAVVVPLVIVVIWRSSVEMTLRARCATAIIRCLFAMLCVVAIAGPMLVKDHVDNVKPRIIVLSDGSRSVAETADEVDRLRRAIGSGIAAQGDVVDLSFAGQTWRPGEPAADAEATDIELALDAANGLTIDASEARVVLISDGRSTRGDALGAARRLGLRGVPVHAMPVGLLKEKGPHLVRSEPPMDAHVGLPAAVRVTVAAEQPTRIRINLIDSEGKTVDQRDLPVEGQKTALLRFTPTKPGESTYTVTTSQLGNETAGGNVQRVPVFAQAPPRILLADHFSDEVQALKRALAPLNVPIDIVSPDDWPDDLSNYAAIIVSDWSGKELTTEQRVALRKYVEEHGGGLVFAGGGNVLPARWKQNPVSAVLPVQFEEKPKELIQKKPDVSVVFVVDRSGSMQQGLATSTGASISKLDLVKSAIIASVQTVPPQSQVAVVTFDDRPTVLVPPTPVSKKSDIIRLVDSTAPGGGTVIEPAIREGMALLATMPGDKYLIVLTDGLGERPATDVGYWGAVADAARKARISWTSIAVGADADQQLLAYLAQEARGKFFYCDTGDSVPKVFLQQANSIKRVADQKEKAFHPKAGPAADRLKDLEINEMPELSGRVRSTARPNTDVLLLGQENEPLLASWQFGLGRVVAFTSDAKAGWAREWITWKGYSPFWIQLLQGVMRVNPALHTHVVSRIAQNQATFIFHITDEAGRPVDGLEAKGTLTSAEEPAATRGEESPATRPADPEFHWRQVRPGEYEGQVQIPSDGRDYRAAMRLTKGTEKSVRYGAIVKGEVGLEVAETGPDLAALKAIAEASGGTVTNDPLDVIAQSVIHREIIVPDRTALWPALMIAALLLWPIDLAARKFL